MAHTIGLVYFAPEEGADVCMKGLFDGLKEQGIEERVNLEVRRAHAQAEIANIPLLIRKVARTLGITFPPDIVQAASQ